MELLKERILKDGTIEEGNILKVDSFLNHQLDISLLNEIGKEFRRRFPEKIDKILTIETSGIGIAAIAAQYFNTPVVYARKIDSKNLEKDVYETKVYSYTKGKEYTVKVGKKYLNKEEKILVIDDFLANGKALEGLIDIISQAGASLVGAGIVIEKGFQEGGQDLRNKGIKIESLAIIESLSDGRVIFK
ncbi:xanthine phosphoribosyltransferase [Tissierella sp. MSJ-40]|uniref:Xanthine phosphoribosyltransferase n=1 Tax=Tissierella simiarum TaxID=2841534 RepID=A0ABS6E4T4_9FIRM|nr:xanthine phosphoribosyltransferase [Tissierella simiarum]